MSKIEWDRKTGGVILKRYITPDTLSVSPRPVFYEELDLLHLTDFGWKYPKVQEPLLWACNKQYYYRGDFVFEVKGANVYDAPTVVFAQGFEKMNLKPVNVNAMLEKNNDQMFLLESEAIEFIRKEYLKYANANNTRKASKANQLDFDQLVAIAEKKTKKRMAIVKEDCDSFDIVSYDLAKASDKEVLFTTKIDRFLASFSGGKDSQVVLDLCTRAIPPQDFEVIYSDTGYELPTSLELYKTIEQHYKVLFPDLSFKVAKNHASVLSYWDKIGTPSDTHRWCCAVMKTAPLYRSLKVDGNKQARVLTFDGVRAEESTRRSGYERTGKGVKHDTVINARPILNWNTTEVFLYLFRHKLLLNPAYRQGMTRVGCLLCPFANEWNEMIANKFYKEDVKPFLSRIESFALKAGVKDVKNYISEGGWKRRASGNLVDQDSFIDFEFANSKLSAIIRSPKVSVLSYFQILGNFTTSIEGNLLRGEIRISKDVYRFSLREEERTYYFDILNINDAVLIALIKKVLLKSTYCIHCETCEVECPTGALKVYPEIQIDKDKCIHCHKCLDFHEKGCVAANSLYITKGNAMTTKVSNIDRYKNFGLKEEWLQDYFSELNGFWKSSHGLNEAYQIPSLRAWLKDAEIIDDKNLVTELGSFLSSTYVQENFPLLTWEIIWINLSYSSFIVNWYVNNIGVGETFTQKILEEKIREQFPTYKEKTVHNAVYQLRRTLKESPIGNQLMQYEVLNKEMFKRGGYAELSSVALAYSIYKYAQKRNIRIVRVSDFYKDDISFGPYKEFGIPRVAFEDVLRTLNSNRDRVLIAELNMGLDNITLREDLNPISVLHSLIK